MVQLWFSLSLGQDSLQYIEFASVRLGSSSTRSLPQLCEACQEEAVGVVQRVRPARGGPGRVAAARCSAVCHTVCGLLFSLKCLLVCFWDVYITSTIFYLLIKC